MLTLYSGTPGAGKSLHVARTIYDRLRTSKRPVIATFPINMDIVTSKGKKKTADCVYCDITDMSTEYLIEHALKNHKLGMENQTLVVIDECQIIYNPREFSRVDRLKWIVFFTQHRKLGYDFVLISQFDRLIDRQIRCLLEYDVVHRKINNSTWWACLLPFKVFVAVNKWYGAKMKVGQEFFIYRKKYGKMYDSFMMFDDAFKSYIEKNGENVSEYNKKVLGLDKPKKEKEQALETDISDEELIDSEVERYADIYEKSEQSLGSRESLKKEVTVALAGIDSEIKHAEAEALRQLNNEQPDKPFNALLKQLPEADKAAFARSAPLVEAGVGGSLPKREEPNGLNPIARIRRFFSKPLAAEPNEAEESGV